MKGSVVGSLSSFGAGVDARCQRRDEQREESREGQREENREGDREENREEIRGKA